MTDLALDDIQGIILRRYRMPTARYFLLTVREPVAARAALGRLVSGDETDAPQVSTSVTPEPTVEYRLNVGITWPGLVALGLPERAPGLSFKSFPAFIAGAASRAAMAADTGPSAPEHWVDGFASDEGHVLVTLYARSRELRESYSQRLAALFAEGGAFAEVWRGDGEALIEVQNGQPAYVQKAHFGYQDGLSEPAIKGGPGPYPASSREPCDPWLFVHMDEAPNYYVPDPPELGRNGSFGVFTIMKQDVVGFENFLQSNKDRIDPELLAAKLMGRWRNGVPLALSPDTDSPPGGIAPEKMDDFDYVNADGSGDPWGERTPIGSHMRRLNPRGQPIVGQGLPGGTNNDHRVLRRALPYGQTYHPGDPDDGVERGLIGYFVNSSIENQFEFVLREWANKSDFVGAARLNPQSKEPIIGHSDTAEGVFEIPQPGGAPPLRIAGFSSFATTRAMAYCFLPSITALKFIAGLECAAARAEPAAMTAG